MAEHRVVVCEDDAATAEFVKRALGKIPGVEVQVCQTLGAALIEVQRQGAHVLVMDHHTPGGNGSEGLRRMRGQPWGEKVPVLVFTAADVEEQARSNGASDFLAKPSSMKEFQDRVQRLLPREKWPPAKDAAPALAQPARPAVTASPAAAPVTPAGKAAAAEPVRKTILIIDDDKLFIQMYKAHLAFRKNLEIVTALSGEEGLRKAATCKPDMVILDYELPDIRGDEVSRRLRQDPATRDVAIALVTSHTQEEAKGAQYDLFLTKPVTPVKIRLLLQKLSGQQAD